VEFLNYFAGVFAGISFNFSFFINNSFSESSNFLLKEFNSASFFMILDSILFKSIFNLLLFSFIFLISSLNTSIFSSSLVFKLKYL